MKNLNLNLKYKLLFSFFLVLSTMYVNAQDCCYDPDIIQGVFCTQEWDPVCGCDGQTYSNECMATESGIKHFIPGECNQVASSCYNPSIITGNYCTQEWDPVCGCNGQTYSNPCYARESGITGYTCGPCGVQNCDPDYPTMFAETGHTYVHIHYHQDDNIEAYRLRWRESGSNIWLNSMELVERDYVVETEFFPPKPDCYCEDECYDLPALSFPNNVMVRGLKPCTDYEFEMTPVCSDGSFSENKVVEYFFTKQCNDEYYTEETYSVGINADLARIGELTIDGEGYDWDEYHQSCYVCAYCPQEDQGYAYMSTEIISLNKGFGVGLGAGNSHIMNLCVDGVSGDYTNWNMSLWIDYNQDGDFDDYQERVFDLYIGKIESPGFCFSSSELEFVVPQTAEYGLTRMRAVLSHGYLPNSSAVFQFGHVLDFPVFIGTTHTYEVSDRNGKSVFPNPASSYIDLSAYGEVDMVSIEGLNGEEVLSETNPHSRVSFNNRLGAGMYILRVRVGDEMFVEKLIIQ